MYDYSEEIYLQQNQYFYLHNSWLYINETVPATHQFSYGRIWRGNDLPLWLLCLQMNHFDVRADFADQELCFRPIFLLSQLLAVR